MPGSGYGSELRIVEGCCSGLRCGDGYNAVFLTRQAQHRTAHRLAIHMTGPVPVEHPIEQLKEDPPRLWTKPLKNRPARLVWHTVQGIGRRGVEAWMDNAGPEGAKIHEPLCRLPLALCRWQDACSRCGTDEDEGTGKSLRGKLLGQDSPHGMAQEYGWLVQAADKGC